MRQEHGMIVLGGIMVLAGFAMLLLPDLNGAGWYLVAAGVLAGGFGYWFHLRGGNVPHPPRDLPRLPEPAPASAGKSCPSCGSGSVRPMDGAETTAFYGYDRFVLVRPRICLVCGHGFESEPTPAGAYLMVAVAAMGVIVGVLLILMLPAGPWLAFRGEGFTSITRIKLALGGPAAAYGGVWWVRRSLRVLEHYWSLRRPRMGGLKPVAVSK